MSAYTNREHFQDSVSGIWWKIGVLLSLLGWVLVALGDFAWLALAILPGLWAWQDAHSGVWVGEDDILVVHPVFGKKRVKLADIERFVVRPFNQWMIAWAITRMGSEIPCQGISSGRKRTQRVDVVVERLNGALRDRPASQPAPSPAAR